MSENKHPITKKRAIVALAAIIAISMIFAGVGYAAYTGTADNTSTGSIGKAYIVMNEGRANTKLIGAGSTINYSTSTDSEGVVTYTVTSATINAGGFYIKKTDTVDATACTVTITDNSGVLDSTRFSLTVSGQAGAITYSNHVWTVPGVTLTTADVLHDVTFSLVGTPSFSAAELTALASISFNIQATVA